MVGGLRREEPEALLLGQPGAPVLITPRGPGLLRGLEQGRGGGQGEDIRTCVCVCFLKYKEDVDIY